VNVVFEMRVQDRTATVEWEVEDAILPRVGDEIFIQSDLTPGPTVVHVQLTHRLDVAYVTLSDLPAVSQEMWQAIHDQIGKSTPGPEARPVELKSPFVAPAGRVRLPPRP
jgi:hypothetical protein